jgi:hypothetical protein
MGTIIYFFAQPIFVRNQRNKVCFRGGFDLMRIGKSCVMVKREQTAPE